MPRTSRLAVGGPAGETTDFGADHKFSPLERMLLTAAVCTEMPAPPTGRALLLGGGPDPPSSRALLLGGGVRPPQQQSALDPALPPPRRRPPLSTLGSCLSVRSRRLCSPRLRAQYTFVVSSAGVLLKTCDHGESILYYHTTLGVRASRLHQ